MNKKGITSDVPPCFRFHRNDRFVAQWYTESRSPLMICSTEPIYASVKTFTIFSDEWYAAFKLWKISTITFVGKFPPVLPFKWRALQGFLLLDISVNYLTRLSMSCHGVRTPWQEELCQLLPLSHLLQTSLVHCTILREKLHVITHE